jgi:hypothetical protein
MAYRILEAYILRKNLGLGKEKKRHPTPFFVPHPTSSPMGAEVFFPAFGNNLLRFHTFLF